MGSDNRKFLLDKGLKDKLLDKLSPGVLKNLVAFAMDNIKAPELQKLLIKLASMEINGKAGASALAVEKVANIEQIKNLEVEQISELNALYEGHEDLLSLKKLAMKMLINNQQERLYYGSGGNKGEYYLMRDDVDDGEEAGLR
jgi:hypothetical protein